MSTYLVPMICTRCGARIEVDGSKESGVCPYCDTPFIMEKPTNNYIIARNVNMRTETMEQLWEKFQKVIKDANGSRVAWIIYTKMQKDYNSDYRSYYAGLLYHCRFCSQYNEQPFCDKCGSAKDVSCCYNCMDCACFTDSSSYHKALQLYEDAKALAPSNVSQEIDNAWNQFMQAYTFSKQRTINERKNAALAEIRRKQAAYAIQIARMRKTELCRFILVSVYVILGVLLLAFCKLNEAIICLIILFIIVCAIWKHIGNRKA